MNGFFTSTEFYVIASMAAAAVIGLCVKPGARGEAIERLLAGHLCDTSADRSDPADAALPQITLSCDPSGNVLLTRSGLSGLTSDGAVSLAVTRIASDITIEERTTYSPLGEPVDTALFTLDFLPPGRYHVRYNSDATGLFAAFSLTVRPENLVTRQLSR